MMKILFVCHGNICRSPMAEFVMRKLASEAGIPLEVASAAVSMEEIGNPVYPPARRRLEMHGISCEGKHARKMTVQDAAEYDLLIGMDNDNIRRMKKICPAEYHDKIRLMPDREGNPHQLDDPWYTGDFDKTFSEVLDGCARLLEEITEEN